ncbi:MAG: cell division protein FtsA [Candidatus Spechtbacterales bacterium]
MAQEHIVVGIDIGTHYVYTVVAAVSAEAPLPQIIGIGRARSYGIRRGTIIDLDDAATAVAESVREAEQSAGVKIERAFLSIDGNHIVSLPSRGVVAVSRADGEISDDDVTRVITAAQTVALPPNREILHTLPFEYIVDNEGGLRDVAGMNGLRLEANALIVGGSSGHIKNLERCASSNNIQIDGLVLAPLAAANAVASKRQKELGVLVLDIGGGTTGLAVFEEGNLLYTNVLPMGGDNITNDLAIGLRTTIEVAERIKREYGAALVSEVAKTDRIDLSKFDPKEKDLVLRRDVVEIIEARMSEIFEVVNKELRKIGKEAMLPGGVVLVGGSSKIPYAVDLCKSKLRLPAQVGFPRNVEGIVGSVDDPSFATVIGLVFWGLERSNYQRARIAMPNLTSFGGSVDKLRGWMRAFLP